MISRSTTELLVSIRNAEEADLARKHGADWIDLKDPAQGPLGRADDRVAREVADRLAGFPKTSIALGELIDLPESPDPHATNSLHTETIGRFQLAKIGLSGCAKWGGWRKRVAELKSRLPPTTDLVCVAYADCEAAQSPQWEEIVDVARDLASRIILVDTYRKDGRNLLDFSTVLQWSERQENLRRSRIALALAGSLQRAAIDQLSQIAPAIIGVRGAVCSDGRQSGLSAGKLKDMVEAIRQLPRTFQR